MLTTLRALAILLLIFPSVAAVAQDTAHPAHAAKRHSAHQTATAKKTPAKTVTKTSAKSAAARKPGAKRAKAAAQKKAGRKVSPLKIKQMHRAFIASSELRVMARQLVEHRTPAAYNGVEDYARRHAGSDAGALAWLADGYARWLDQQYPQAIAALEKARPRAGELADYVRYLEALCYAGEGNSAKVTELLRHFEDEAPESIFVNDVVSVYGTALDAQGRSQDAIAYLEAHRTPLRASVEYALGRSYLHAQNTAKGMEILRHIYFTMPTSEQAVEAASALTANGSALEGSYADERTRADLLARAGRLPEAAKAYRALEERAPLGEIANVQVALAATERHSNASESRSILEQAHATGESNAQRLYLLGEFARNDNNEAAVSQNLETMRHLCVGSNWFQQALLSAGNMYLLQKNYDRAIDMFREAQQRFPASEQASYAHWKAAWLTYRQGRTDQAKHDFEDQVSWYPARTEVPAALYWRARIAEDEHDYGRARAWYGKLAARFRNYYYGTVAQERLKTLPASAEGVSLHSDPVLAMIPDVKASGPEAMRVEPPQDELRAEKARLLVNAGLNEYAIRELEAEHGGQGASWATLQIARIYEQSGDSHKAMRFLKRALPGYYAMEISELPLAYWEILFPRPYWTDLERNALANSLDPNLVASLIRQESEFEPSAVSHANAIGLMQLLPSVGRDEARAAHIKHFEVSSLLTPGINIQLGTRYFHAMVSQYNGRVEYALAAYNAGSNRVDEWLQTGHYHDVPEFVESIPFTETREYVQAIMRNAQVYQRLYPR
jgi:soluble lytic murein transglycosylase